ncbi:glycosyltransferase family 2 protein [Coleofasciculus sp. F4-SAH-05]|uniref:glycosyltransferase family 2 protein n=1 Tax=Coleofasciculus sp. F4-SAH-05 TaxID=3069525 RepID=UPI0032F7937F
MTHPSTILIIPCYNEENNVGKLLREIQELNPGYDTLVIDDGSQDNTYAVASQLSPCVKLLTNLGIGGAVQTGIKYALQHNYELCVQVDGDGQHPPSQVYRLIESYLKSPANLIISSRFLRKKGFKSTWKRRLGIKIISQVIQLLFQHKITDPTSGLRMMDRKAIQLFSTEYPHDFPEPISLAVALERGLRVREVAVNMRSREQGFSSITGIKSFLYMIRVIGYLILVRMGRHL